MVKQCGTSSGTGPGVTGIGVNGVGGATGGASGGGAVAGASGTAAGGDSGGAGETGKTSGTGGGRAVAGWAGEVEPTRWAGQAEQVGRAKPQAWAEAGISGTAKGEASAGGAMVKQSGTSLGTGTGLTGTKVTEIGVNGAGRCCRRRGHRRSLSAAAGADSGGAGETARMGGAGETS